jgi:hypothetical protein
MDRHTFEASLAYLAATSSLPEARRIAVKAIALRDRTEDPDPEARARLNALQAAAQLRIAALSTVIEWAADYLAAEAMLSAGEKK